MRITKLKDLLNKKIKTLRKIYTVKNGVNVRKENEKNLNIKNQNQN